MMSELKMIEDYDPMFSFIDGYVGGDDTMPDGEWHQLHVEAVERYNELEGTNYDFFDFQVEYFAWVNNGKKYYE